MSIPNPGNPMFWIVVALIVAYFGVDYIGLIPAAFGKLWSFVPGLPKIATPADATARIGSTKAFADVAEINTFLATEKDDPNFKLVVAALKTLEAA